MGNSLKKVEEPDPRTGLTATECKLIRKSWHDFCIGNGDYGVILFKSFFIKSPESLKLFRHFRSKSVGSLPDDPHFRAHACSVGYQLTSMVEFVDDPPLLEALIRKNAFAHTERMGATPEKFVVLGQTVVEVLSARNERLMTPATVAAWRKLFACMNTITVKVFEEEGVGIPSPTQTPAGSRQTGSDHAAAGSAGTDSGGATLSGSAPTGAQSVGAASPGAASPGVQSPGSPGAKSPMGAAPPKHLDRSKKHKNPRSPTSPRKAT